MKLICAACGNAMVVEGELQDGARVRCPFCGEVTVCSRPRRIEVPLGAVRESVEAKDETPKEATSKRKLRVIRKDPPPSNRPGYQAVIPPPVANNPPPPRANNLRKGGGYGGTDIAKLIAALLVLGVAFWGVRTFVFKAEDVEEAEVVPVQTEAKPESVDEEAARRQKAAEEEAARRQKAQEEEERRQAERQRERERKEKERAEARAELARKAEAERKARESYRAAQDAFSGKPSHFAESASKDKIDDPRRANENARFWAIDKTFAEQGCIYEIATGTQGVASVGLRMMDGRLQDVAVDEFVPRLDKGVWAISNGEVVWLFGTGKQIRTVAIPKGDAEVYPMGDELGELDVAMETLQIQTPDVRYRLSLKPRNGGEAISLGIIQGRDRLSLRRTREEVKGEIVERQARTRLASLRKPKLKKFKQTVVFYDGDIIKKGIDGVTRIPRTFKYLGTSRYDDYIHISDVKRRTREKWERMRDEAERQERRVIEVNAENHAAMEAYERQCEEARSNVSVSDKDIDEELKKYVLLIERSRTKVAEAD